MLITLYESSTRHQLNKTFVNSFFYLTTNCYTKQYISYHLILFKLFKCNNK